jgi:curved DNA-binding protein CbpA
MTNPYVVLGVSPMATQDEITHAYRRHLRDHHPDIRPPAPNGDADERLRQILAAYALLRDPHRRAAYDPAPPRRHARRPDQSRYQPSTTTSKSSHRYGQDQCVGTPTKCRRVPRQPGDRQTTPASHSMTNPTWEDSVSVTHRGSPTRRSGRSLHRVLLPTPMSSQPKTTRTCRRASRPAARGSWHTVRQKS